MSMYEAYLPHLNANDGIKRIMNNKKLYYSMLERFKLQEMAEAIRTTVSAGDPDAENVAFTTHALKGTLGNLGFPVMYAFVGEMENLAKKGDSIEHLMPQFNTMTNEVAEVIKTFLANEKP